METTEYNETAEQNKSQVRAWIYQLLADLEYAQDVEAHKNETAGREITIKIQLKG